MTKQNLLNDAQARGNKLKPGYCLDGQGLYLQVREDTTQKSWIYRYAIDGKQREMGLGSLRDVSLAQAREMRQAYRQLVLKKIDPIEYRARELARSKAEFEGTGNHALTDSLAVTFEQCAREYFKTNSDNWKSKKHADQWLQSLAKHIFPPIGSLAVEQVSKQDIVEALSPVWKKRVETARRLLQRIHVTMNFAAAKDYCSSRDSEFWAQVKLSLGNNDRAGQVVHHDSCPHSQVGALVRTVMDTGTTASVKLAFYFSILTAARPGEIRGATWSEIDFGSSFWIIPAARMKAGKEHRVPLSTEALAVLATAKTLQEERGDAFPLIFPNDRGLQMSDMTLNSVMRRLELKYTSHGFRASFRTWGQEATEYSDEILEMALAHATGDKTVQAYARSAMVERRRQLMQDWATYVGAVQLKVERTLSG